MENVFTGLPVSAEWIAAIPAVVMTAGSRCRDHAGAEFVRTRAFADLAGSAPSGGQVSPEPGAVLVGVRPAGMQRNHPYVDLDPQRPRPSGGCPS